VNLTTHIFIKMNSNHRGRSNPILRAELLDYLRQLEGEHISDRDMRRAYEMLPMCECKEGLYFPGALMEKKKQVDINYKKAMALLRKNRIIEEYQIPVGPVQGRLF